MFARKLTPQEYWRASLNMAVAFESGFEYENEREKVREADPKEDLYGVPPRGRAACGLLGDE